MTHQRSIPSLLVATLLVAACLLGSVEGQKCGNQFIGTWEGKLRVVQEHPAPTVAVGEAYLVYWTYTRVVIEPDADSIQQTIVAQTYADQLVCSYTCSDDEPVGHSGANEINIVGGSVQSGSDTAFTCDPNGERNMQLVARCTQGMWRSMSA